MEKEEKTDNWNDVNKWKPMTHRVVIVKDKQNREIRAKYIPRLQKRELDNLNPIRWRFGKPTHWISEMFYKI
jgi:hypothetical protein